MWPALAVGGLQEGGRPLGGEDALQLAGGPLVRVRSVLALRLVVTRQHDVAGFELLDGLGARGSQDAGAGGEATGGRTRGSTWRRTRSASRRKNNRAYRYSRSAKLYDRGTSVLNRSADLPSLRPQDGSSRVLSRPYCSIVGFIEDI